MSNRQTAVAPSSGPDSFAFSSDHCFVSTDQSAEWCVCICVCVKWKCVECCAVCSDFLSVFGGPVLVDIDWWTIKGNCLPENMSVSFVPVSRWARNENGYSVRIFSLSHVHAWPCTGTNFLLGDPSWHKDRSDVPLPQHKRPDQRAITIYGSRMQLGNKNGTLLVFSWQVLNLYHAFPLSNYRRVCRKLLD